MLDLRRQILLRLIATSEQLTLDSQSLNEGDDVPFDCEPERVIINKAKRALAALDAGNLGEYNRLSADISEYAASVIPEAEARAYGLNRPETPSGA